MVNNRPACDRRIASDYLDLGLDWSLATNLSRPSARPSRIWLAQNVSRSWFRHAWRNQMERRAADRRNSVISIGSEPARLVVASAGDLSPTWRSMKSSSTDGTLRPSRPRRRSISCAMACETSSARLVSGLNMITRSGSQCCPAHQIGDGGFIVGAVEVGLCERRAEPAIVVDDDVIIFGRTRNNRGPFTHTQLPLYGQRLYGQGWVWDSRFWHERPARIVFARLARDGIGAS